MFRIEFTFSSLTKPNSNINFKILIDKTWVVCSALILRFLVAKIKYNKIYKVSKFKLNLKQIQLNFSK